MSKNYELKNRKDTPETSEVVLTISIPETELSSLKEKALKALGEGVKLDGFREGKVPTEVLEKKVGELHVLEEEINIWLRDNLSKMLAEEKIPAITIPKINIKTLAPKNPVELDLIIPIKPEFDLPDYKKIAEKINKKYKEEVKLDDKEIEDALTSIKQYLAHGTKTDPSSPASSAPSSATATDDKKATEAKDLTDDDVQKISPFKTVSEFMDNLKQNMLADKKRKNQEKNRAEIIDEILKQVKFGVPEVMVEGELQQMTKEFEGNITRMGMKFEDYLKNIGKKLEDLQKEWQEMAEKRVRSEMVISRITGQEKIEAKKEDIEHEANHIMEHNKDLKKPEVVNYVTWILSKEETLKFLERI